MHRFLFCFFKKINMLTFSGGKDFSLLIVSSAMENTIRRREPECRGSCWRAATEEYENSSYPTTTRGQGLSEVGTGMGGGGVGFCRLKLLSWSVHGWMSVFLCSRIRLLLRSRWSSAKSYTTKETMCSKVSPHFWTFWPISHDWRSQTDAGLSRSEACKRFSCLSLPSFLLIQS